MYMILTQLLIAKIMYKAPQKYGISFIAYIPCILAILSSTTQYQKLVIDFEKNIINASLFI